MQVDWFINSKNMMVYVEAKTLQDSFLVDNPAFTKVEFHLKHSSKNLKESIKNLVVFLAQ